jgi:hypothetical protein
MLLPRLDPVQKARIDQKFANAIFESGSPFSLFEHPAFKEAFAELGYTPPNRKMIGDKLLEESYNECQRDVANQLSHSNSLTLTTNESTNVSSNRMMNYCATTSSNEYFFIKSVEAPVGTLSAEVVLDGIVETCQSITNGDMTRWKAVSTDTCSAMLSMGNKLRLRPETHHMMAVLCDSHRLQLLIKDLLETCPLIIYA